MEENPNFRISNDNLKDVYLFNFHVVAMAAKHAESYRVNQC